MEEVTDLRRRVAAKFNASPRAVIAHEAAHLSLVRPPEHFTPRQCANGSRCQAEDGEPDQGGGAVASEGGAAGERGGGGTPTP